MVSPCKKKRTEKTQRAVADQVGTSSVATQSNSTANSRKTRNNLTKPLSGKRIFFDLKNQTSSKKIEAKVISLGGTVELFLVKEVNYVVTDKEHHTNKASYSNQRVPTPSPLPSFCSVSPATTDSPTDGVTHKRTRSRAEAMLERASVQNQKSNSVLDKAVSWKIPIYSLERFISWLDKVSKKAASNQQDKSKLNRQEKAARGVKELRGHFLKIETGSRPEFKEFQSWPSLGLFDFPPDNNNLGAKLDNSKKDNVVNNEPNRMTKKVGRTTKESSSAPGGGNGYCEMCRVNYDQLDTHVVSAGHVKLVTDPAQYSQLDSIIQQHKLGASSVRKSLRIAKSPPPFLPPGMGGRQSSAVDDQQNNKSPPVSNTPLTNGHATRARSMLPSIVLHQVNVNGSDRRSTRHQDSTKSAYQEIEGNACTDHNLRSRKLSGSSSASAQSTSQVQTLTPVIERLAPTNTKSTVASPNASPRTVVEPLQATERQLRASRKTGQKTSNTVNHKTSSSSLAAVTSSSSTSSTATSPPPRKRERVDKKVGESSRLKHAKSSKRRTSSAPRKRLSVEEKLIEDNKSYYKVEVLSSKLRSTEYFKHAEEKGHGKGEALVNSAAGRAHAGNGCRDEGEKPVVVRIKKVRKSELAVLSDEAETFMFGETAGKREDLGSGVSAGDVSSHGGVDGPKRKKVTIVEEKPPSTVEKSVLKDLTPEKDPEPIQPVVGAVVKQEVETERFATSSEKKEGSEVGVTDGDPAPGEPVDVEIPLPPITYSFESEPSDEPWYQTIVREAECRELYIPLNHDYPKVTLPGELRRRRGPKASSAPPAAVISSSTAVTPNAMNPIAAMTPATEPRTLIAGSSGRGKRRSRLSRLLDDRPRKSPRCHASTLAIISLMKKRPTRECSERPFSYEEESSLTETVESSGSNSNGPTGATATSEHLAGASSSRGPEERGLPDDDLIAAALLKGQTFIDNYEPGSCLSWDPCWPSETNDIGCPATPPGLNVPINSLIDSIGNFDKFDIDEVMGPNSFYFPNAEGGWRFNADSCASSDCSDLFSCYDEGGLLGFKPRRRRKKRRNMTGWPNTPARNNSKYHFGLTGDSPVPSPASAPDRLIVPGTVVKRRGRPPKNRQLLDPPAPPLRPPTPPPVVPPASASPPPPTLSAAQTFTTSSKGSWSPPTSSSPPPVKRQRMKPQRRPMLK